MMTTSLPEAAEIHNNIVYVCTCVFEQGTAIVSFVTSDSGISVVSFRHFIGLSIGAAVLEYVRDMRLSNEFVRDCMCLLVFEDNAFANSTGARVIALACPGAAEVYHPDVAWLILSLTLAYGKENQQPHQRLACFLRDILQEQLPREDQVEMLGQRLAQIDVK
jgi:hypothetical protein